MPKPLKLPKSVSRTDVPDELFESAELLCTLANKGFGSNWQDVSMGEHIKAQRATLGLCRESLNQIEEILNLSVSDSVRHYEEQLKFIKGKKRKRKPL